MDTLFINRTKAIFDGTQEITETLAMLTDASDVVRFGIDSSDAGGTVIVDLARNEVIQITEWLDSWLFGHGQTARHFCNQHHAHLSPGEVELCDMAYQHIEAARARADASGRSEIEYRQKLNELQDHIQAIMDAVQMSYRIASGQSWMRRKRD